MPRRAPFFLFALLLCIVATAQQYNFRSYSVADGLAQSQVYAMAEDSRGYLWLGTQGAGLSRFDGKEFRTFSEDDGLVDGFIRCITTDAAGNVWIGTNQGACKYDGKKFTKLKYPGDDGPVNCLYFTRDGRLWVGTQDSGLIVFKDGAIQSHFGLGKDLPSNRVYCVYEDEQEYKWIGTEMGVAKMKGNIRKMYNRKDGLPVTTTRAIAKDGSGRLWFATYGGGLCWYANEKFVRFSPEGGISNNTTHCMITDKLGRLWVGTASGITRIHGTEVKIFSEREGLCSNVVMSVLEDSGGSIWFGTSGGGACMLDGERFIHFTEKSGNMGPWVGAVFCDRDGHLWFGTSNGGVTEYDGTYYTNYFEGAGFTSAKVKSIWQDTSGTMWFGTVGDGAYSRRDGSFRHYTRSAGLSSSFVYDFLTDTMGRVWMATAGGGIAIHDPENERFETIGTKEGLSLRIQSLLLDERSGNVWATSVTSGIYLLEYDSNGTRVKRRYTKKDGLQSDIVRCAANDKDGNAWFGTAGGGICRYAAGKFQCFTKKEGLASNNIYVLLPDKDRNLWVGTEKGLDRITFDRRNNIASIKHYGKGEGLLGIETSLNAGCLDTAGGLWFGTISGASVYHPEHDKVNQHPPKVHITGIRLFFDPIENTPYWDTTASPGWFPVPKSIELPYAQNHLRFEFTGIDLRNPDGVRFRWKLNGFDKDWSPENNERQATYSNLPPGDYTFIVQAKNSDGFWSEEKSFSFRITPPVWATWPFRLGAGLLILALIVFLFSWRVRIIKRKNHQQLEKVTLEKHVLELEQKALRLQMNPHFIFNALQSIQGFIARNDAAEARRYLAKFGKLMRLTLENSRQSYTSIAQEAESLQHYLGLEALCHGNRFTYAIEIDPRFDPEATFIPVMLIQPFVENAVLHGMRHLGEKEGKITIRFLSGHPSAVAQGDKKIKDGTIICEIEDNGVGRAKAAMLESETRNEHKSAALDITRERLAQSNEKGKPESKLEIVDLYDADGNASGTKVVIRIGNVVYE